MSDKFLGKYRSESVRLQSWDYGNNGAYFITICTHDRVCFFGDVENGAMRLNEIGIVANNIWAEIPKQFSFVELGEYVVMPNHVHGILVINKPESIFTDNHMGPVIRRDAINRVPTNNGIGGITGYHNPMLHQNISRVVRWYKGRCSFEIRKIHSDFAWQSRFHDHVIRNTVAYKRIANYIANNPVYWVKDKLNLQWRMK